MKSKIFIGLALLVGLMGCSSVPDIAYRKVPNNVEAQPISIYAIEIDDKGVIHDDEQLGNFRSAMSGDAEIIGFIHGWHHNAAVSDSNYQEFKKFIKQYSENEKVLARNRKVIGLYVGWRGDSVKSIFDPISQTLGDFWTIWNRKDASVVVGKVGMKKINDNLKEALSMNNVRVAVIGHSLGGSVLFNAVKDNLREDDKFHQNLTYILLNPAISSIEYAAADLKGFSNVERKPLLVTIQSDKDLAANFAFRFAYMKTPVGFDDSFITHDMWACYPEDGSCMDKLSKKALNNHCVTTYNENSWFIDARDKNGSRAPACTDANKRIDWVIKATNTVSKSHNGIMTDAEVSALADLLK